MANHLWLDLDLVEFLSGVDTNDGTNHLWDDDHVTEVSLDSVWLLVWLGLLLGLAELLDQTHWLALESAVEPSASTSVDDIAQLLGREVEEPVQACQRPCDLQVVCPLRSFPLTRQGRYRGMRTCGTLSCASALLHNRVVSPISYLPAPLCGPSTGFSPLRQPRRDAASCRGLHTGGLLGVLWANCQHVSFEVSGRARSLT